MSVSTLLDDSEYLAAVVAANDPDFVGALAEFATAGEFLAAYAAALAAYGIEDDADDDRWSR